MEAWLELLNLKPKQNAETTVSGLTGVESTSMNMNDKRLKEAVFKVDLFDDKAKQNVMKTACGIIGVDSLSMDMKDKKLTVTGDFDPVHLVSKLRKICHTEILSVGPPREPKKQEQKKNDPKDDDVEAELVKAYKAYNPRMTSNYHGCVEKDPNAVGGRGKPNMMQPQGEESDALQVESAGNQMISETSGKQGSKAESQRIEHKIVQIQEIHEQSYPSSALGQNDMPTEMSLEATIQNGMILVNSTIQPEDGKLFLRLGGLGLTEPPKEEEWENAKEIHLMDNELSELPENPRCPILSALFLERNYKLRLIPYSFFDYMPALQVLNLSSTRIRSLPESLFRLVSLKRLFLNDCRNFMMLSPKIGELKQLEVLDLKGTEIMDLPREMKNLTRLKCLEVSLYGYANDGRRLKQSNAMVHSGIISALSVLEELNIDVNPDDERWDACAEAIVNEVCSLMILSTLKFYFPRVELLSHFEWNSTSMVYPLLSNFRFIVGHHISRIMTRLPHDVEFELERWDRCLKYVNGVGIPLEIKKVLRHATAFHLDRHTTVKKLSDFGVENMEQLKCCVVGECNELQVLIDGGDFIEKDDSGEVVSESYGDRGIGLQSLEYLYLYYMKNLRSIWEGPLHQRCLILLKFLTLQTCPLLTTIFMQESLANLCSLEELTVEDCPAIISLFSCENSSKSKSYCYLPKLKKISIHYLPELASICDCPLIAPNLEWVSFYYCPKLKKLPIDKEFNENLKNIKGESKHESEYSKLKNGDLVGVGPSKGGGGGIKGERPLVVALPPGKLRPVVDNVSSTWDILKSFGPQEDEDWVSPVQVGFISRLGEEDRVIEENEVVNGGIVERGRLNVLRLRETDDDLTSYTSTSDKTKSNISTDIDSISPNGKFQRTITYWQKGVLLGCGSFGSVYEGITDDGFFFAVKEVSLMDQGSQGKQSILQLEQEISLLSQFEHENIVRYLGTDKDDAKLYIFLELVKGSLASLYQRYKLTDSHVSAYTRQILSGLKYLHERNVAHRNIKCANVLVDASGSVKLADFGLVKATKWNDIKSIKGSAFWMAPEVVNGKDLGYGLAADIWSLGCTVLEMLTRRPPYSDLEAMQALFMISRGDRPPIPNSLSRDAREFILKCIQVDPKDRPTAAQVLEHPFVKRPISTPSGLPSLIAAG